MANVDIKSRWRKDWEITNPVLRNGEPGHDKNTNRLKIGDGRRPWNELPYLTDENYAERVIADLVTKRVVYLGLYTDPEEPQAPAEFIETAGESPTLVLNFYSYANGPDVARWRAIHESGAVPVIGWMPDSGTSVANQPDYQLADILAGKFDTYMRNYLTAIRDLGFPVYLRWAHEPNGNWYPWSEQVNGNTAGQYAQAWRYVHNLAASVGANNISWVWSMNTNYGGSTPLPGLYPGDAYVDVVGMHGYNWGATGPDGYRTPETLFGSTIKSIDAVAPNKPLWISEMGCAPDDGFSKPEWYGQFFTWLLNSRVSGFIYFDTFKAEVPGEKDWRVNSSPASAAAFSAGMVKLREKTRADGIDVFSQLASPRQLAEVTAQVSSTPGSPISLWGGGGSETLSRAGLSVIPGVSGRLRLAYVTAPVTVTINTLAVVASDPASSGATVARLAVFSVDDSGKLTKIAQTANDITMAAEPYSDSQRALSTVGGFPGEVTLVAGRRYAFGWLNVATTPASIRGATVDLGGLKPYINKHINGQTDIANSYTDAQLTGFYQPPFIAGIKY